jgi:hypothetical protein
MERRDAWRKTLDREIQLNTMQIDQMRAAADRGLGFGIAAPLLQFIAREGWKIGYAANGAIVRWDSLREWIEDYPDNGGLHTTVNKVLPYVCQVPDKPNALQADALKKFLTALDQVDRLAVRPEALKVAELLGDEEIVDIVHDTTKRGSGGDYTSEHPLVSNAGSTRLSPNTKQGARQQLRAYAADPDRCARYGKDHALCQEAWVKVERGEMSVNEGRIFCGLQKAEPPRMFYATKDVAKLADKMLAVLPADVLRSLITLLQEKLNDL